MWDSSAGVEGGEREGGGVVVKESLGRGLPPRPSNHLPDPVLDNYCFFRYETLVYDPG